MQNTVKTPPRRLSRMKAFQFLYGQEFAEARTQIELEQAFEQFPAHDLDVQETSACEGFAWELVAGVWYNREKLDHIIQEHAKNWRIDRVGRVELGLLRIAIYEMLYRDDVPAKVAINEALELNKQFGEAKSRAFINGILDATSKTIEAKTIS